MSRFGVVGNVRLRTVARWFAYGEEGAESALLAGVIA